MNRLKNILWNNERQQNNGNIVKTNNPKFDYSFRYIYSDFI